MGSIAGSRHGHRGRVGHRLRSTRSAAACLLHRCQARRPARSSAARVSDTVFASTGGGVAFAGVGRQQHPGRRERLLRHPGGRHERRPIVLARARRWPAARTPRLQLQAGTGNETIALNYGSLNNVIFAGNSTSGGIGQYADRPGRLATSTVFAGTGNYTAAGGTGADLYRVLQRAARAASDFINNFNAAKWRPGHAAELCAPGKCSQRPFEGHDLRCSGFRAATPSSTRDPRCPTRRRSSSSG